MSILLNEAWIRAASHSAVASGKGLRLYALILDIPSGLRDQRAPKHIPKNVSAQDTGCLIHSV